MFVSTQSYRTDPVSGLGRNLLWARVRRSRAASGAKTSVAPEVRRNRASIPWDPSHARVRRSYSLATTTGRRGGPGGVVGDGGDDAHGVQAAVEDLDETGMGVVFGAD